MNWYSEFPLRHYLTRKNKNPSLPVKFTSSLFFVGIGYIAITLLISVTGIDARFSVLWFFPVYFIFTMGELMIGPIGFSMVDRLSPLDKEGVLMGIWQLCIGVAGAATIFFY